MIVLLERQKNSISYRRGRSSGNDYPEGGWDGETLMVRPAPLATPWSHGPIVLPIGDSILLSAIRIFALLAYPEDGGDAKRDDFVEAGKAWMTKRAVAIRGVEGRPKGRLKSGFSRKLTGLKNEFIDRTFRAGFFRIEKRFEAVQIFSHAMLRRASAGTSWIDIRPAPQQKNGRGIERMQLTIGNLDELPPLRSSIQTVIRDLYSPRDEDSVSNLRRGVWQSSLPVLHLAIAVRDAWNKMSLSHPEWRTRNVITCLISNPDEWVEQSLIEAENWRVALPQLMPDIVIGRLIPVRVGPKTARR